MKTFVEVLSALIFATGLVLVLGAGTYVATLPCGPLHSWHAQSFFGDIQHHVEAMDRSLQNNLSAPSYMIAQIKGDLRTLQTQGTPVCFAPAEVSLECAIQNEIIYADKWSLESGNPVSDKARKQYQACMSNYYAAMNELKTFP